MSQVELRSSLGMHELLAFKPVPNEWSPEISAFKWHVNFRAIPSISRG